MKIEFLVDFDGTLDIQPGDSLELQILGEYGGYAIEKAYEARLVRQTGVRPSPPDLGVNVSDDAGISDRIG